MSVNTTDIERLTLTELRDRVEQERAQHELLRRADEISERQIRYYIQQRLLPRPGSRGPGTRYPESLIWRILFVLYMQQYGLSLDNIRKAMRDLPESTIQDVIQGREPLTINSDLSPGEISARLDAGEQLVYLDEETKKDKRAWKTITKTDRLRIEVFGPISAHQRKLITQASNLLKTALAGADETSREIRGRRGR